MPSIRASELMGIVYDSLCTGSVKGEEIGSIYIEGSPGIGKSEIVQGAVALYNQRFGKDAAGLVDVRLTLCDPSDLRGIPYPDEINNIAKWMPPDILPYVGSDKFPEKGILFLDDFPTAPQIVQSAAYELIIQPHRLGNYQLPSGWVIVGAGNKTSDRANANKIPTAMISRFIKINYGIYDGFVNDWSQWAGENNIDNHVLGFLNSSAAITKDFHLIYDFDPGATNDSYACPRSWVTVSNILKRGYPNHIAREMVAGAVGKNASSVFFNFMDVISQLPSVSIILNGENLDLKLENADEKYAMMVVLANSIENDEQMNNAITWAINQPLEFVTMFLRMIGPTPEKLQRLRKLPATIKAGQKLVEAKQRLEASRPSPDIVRIVDTDSGNKNESDNNSIDNVLDVATTKTSKRNRKS